MTASARTKLGAFLCPESPWSPAEQAVIKWQFGLSGDFKTALWGAITKADDGNLKKLALGFPDEVQGFLMWQRGNLGERLRCAGLEV